MEKIIAIVAAPTSCNHSDRAIEIYKFEITSTTRVTARPYLRPRPSTT